ncbi:hypothetical protein SmJEL517_g04207 [Synchytrium microbalum]|uniref:THO complex subunit 2 n=1 Tax=Synchytrium microbalum TaxID=1806994 RepID=A0A507BZY9_9FUNG|nr:uncharacterized protein SmJEL517_g04207 [Synchytrium microbalum]TPX32701.1 hypothetical protein SmJEL517_g04207 [Synchytrium microbalum]
MAWQRQLDTWETGGRKSLLETAIEYSAYEPSPEVARENHLGILSIIRDIFRAVVERRLAPTSAAFFLSEWNKQVSHGQDNDNSGAGSSTAANPTSTSLATSGKGFELGEGLSIGSLVVDALDTFHATTDKSMAQMYGLMAENNDGDERLSDAPRVRLEEFARAILKENFVPIEKFLSVLEGDFIEALAADFGVRVPPNPPGYYGLFSRRAVKYSTMTSYKQTKFNLLREESEGYAKLITELTTDLPPPVDSWTAAYIAPGESSPRERRIKTRVASMLKNIKAIIGYFYLDPNRVLDIILDVFAMDVKDQWDFFLELLLASPWKRRTPVPEPPKQLEPQKTEESEKKDPAKPDKGKNDAKQPERDRIAQILGFKFLHYSNLLLGIRGADTWQDLQDDSYDGHPDTVQQTIRSLYQVAALLIKYRVMDFAELYPYLSPADTDFQQERLAYRKDLESRRNSRFENAQDNVLALAGGLDERTSIVDTGAGGVIVTAERVTEERARALRRNQKANLTEILLGIGALQDATRVMHRLPDMAAIFPDVAQNFLRCLHEYIEPYYRPICPILLSQTKVRFVPTKESVALLQAQFPAATTETRTSPLATNVFDTLTQGKKLVAPKWRFFFPHWRDEIKPHPETPKFIKDLRAMLTYIGPGLNKDLMLAVKIARMGIHYTKDDAPLEMKQQWLYILSQHLLPALSLSDSNPAFSSEIWKLMANYPYQIRWNLYQDWDERSQDNIVCPELYNARTICLNDIRFIMKRLSAENIKVYGRGIGKIVHSNPTTALNYLIQQISGDNMDNFINLVSDASRYLSELDFDVLAYTLVRQLGDKSLKKTIEDGLTPTTNFAAIAKFVGTVYRKHQQTELAGLLAYLKNRFEEPELYDMLVLSEVVGQMSTLRYIENPTDKGLEGLAGGEALKRESSQLERQFKKHSVRLASALNESKLADQFAILLAQQLRDLPFIGSASSTDLKTVAVKVDQIKKVFLQYTEFFATSADVEAYARTFPSLEELVDKYGLEMDYAFHLMRPTLAQLVKKNPHPDEVARAAEVMDVDQDTDPNIPPWQPALLPTIEAVTRLLPKSFTDALPVPFFVTFWQLSLYDIHVPTERYEDEMRTQLGNSKKLMAEASRPDVDSKDRSKKTSEANRASSAADALRKELKIHTEHNAVVKQRLERERKYWLPDYERIRATELFCEQCLLPRAMMSYADAEYCAKFIFLLHTLPTRNFPTVFVLERMFNAGALRALLASSTELEIRCLAVFYKRLLQVCMGWMQDATSYTIKALGDVGKGEGRPGFVRKWTGEVLHNHDAVPKEKLVPLEQYRLAVGKWHVRISLSITASLQTGIYVQQRNALLFANGLVGLFPAFNQQGIPLLDVLKEYVAEEETPDLKQLAISYRGNIYKEKHTWRGKIPIVPVKPPAVVALNNAVPIIVESIPDGILEATMNSELLTRRSTSRTNNGVADVEIVSTKPGPTPTLSLVFPGSSAVIPNETDVDSMAPPTVPATNTVRGRLEGSSTALGATGTASPRQEPPMLPPGTSSFARPEGTPSAATPSAMPRPEVRRTPASDLPPRPSNSALSSRYTRPPIQAEDSPMNNGDGKRPSMEDSSSGGSTHRRESDHPDEKSSTGRTDSRDATGKADTRDHRQESSRDPTGRDERNAERESVHHREPPSFNNNNRDRNYDRDAMSHRSDTRGDRERSIRSPSPGGSKSSTINKRDTRDTRPHGINIEDDRDGTRHKRSTSPKHHRNRSPSPRRINTSTTKDKDAAPPSSTKRDVSDRREKTSRFSTVDDREKTPIYSPGDFDVSSPTRRDARDTKDTQSTTGGERKMNISDRLGPQPRPVESESITTPTVPIAATPPTATDSASRRRDAERKDKDASSTSDRKEDRKEDRKDDRRDKDVTFERKDERRDKDLDRKDKDDGSKSRKRDGDSDRGRKDREKDERRDRGESKERERRKEREKERERDRGTSSTGKERKRDRDGKDDRDTGVKRSRNGDDGPADSPEPFAAASESIPTPSIPVADVQRQSFSILGSGTRNSLKRAAEEAASSTRFSPNPIQTSVNPGIPAGGATSATTPTLPPPPPNSAKRARTEIPDAGERWGNRNNDSDRRGDRDRRDGDRRRRY